VIIKNKNICGGKPHIKGTRLTVGGVLQAIAISSGFAKPVLNVVASANERGIKITARDVDDCINYAIKKMDLDEIKGRKK
jgi:uncharacterized protein (DUF433 family)